MAGDVRNTKRFRELAAFLRQQADQHGVTLMPGAAEELLAERVGAIAKQLRITQRTVLDRYVSEETLPLLAQQLGEDAGEYREAVVNAEPVTIKVADVGHIVAAIGMVIKLATEHAVSHQTDALGILTDSADALVGLGVAISTAKGADELQFGGEHLVWTRKIINRTIEFIGDDSWACPCGNPHAGQPACRLQRQLTGDLHLVGGWLPDEN